MLSPGDMVLWESEPSDQFIFDNSNCAYANYKEVCGTGAQEKYIYIFTWLCKEIQDFEK